MKTFHAPGLLLVCSAAASGVFAAAGCYDFTPVTSLPPVPLPDTGVPETSTEDGGEAGVVKSPCAECAERSCVETLDACKATPKCEPFYECGITLRCYSPDADKIACFTDCGRVSGVNGYEDPAIGPALALDACIGKACADVCR